MVGVQIMNVFAGANVPISSSRLFVAPAQFLEAGPCIS